MQLNRNQKILTIIYCIGILIILFALTPAYFVEHNDKLSYYGSFFHVNPDRVFYGRFFAELGTWTLFYLLFSLILKTPEKKL
jgi:hypothetical protein